MIPAEAVEAAAKAYRREFPYDENEGYVVKLILEAAAPYMRQAFFLEMNLRAVQDELSTPLQLGKNPYRE